MSNAGEITATSLCHWGAFDATVEGGRLVKTVPWPGSGAAPGMIGAWRGDPWRGPGGSYR